MKRPGAHKTVAPDLGGSRKRKFEAEDFANMPKLHCVEMLDGCNLDRDLKCMSKELQWLQWRGMSYKHVTMKLDVSHLTFLDFSKSINLASLWTESNCKLEGCPHLLLLNVEECTSITKLPDSIGQSSRLQNLKLSGCSKLKMLPSSIGQLLALENLYVSGCTSFKKLPNSIGLSSRLQYLDLHDCSKLKKLPDSIGQLKELKDLSIWSCTSLKALPDTIGALSNLQRLSAYGCTSLVTLPPSIGLWSTIRWLWLGASTNYKAFLDGIWKAWIQLQFVYLFSCGGLLSLLGSGALKDLEKLSLEDNTITELPESIGQLICLQELAITCERLQCLPKSIGDLQMLKCLELCCCDNLKKLPKTLGALTGLKHLWVEICPITKLPRSVGQLSGLQWLEMSGCLNLQKLPTSIRNLQGLRRFMLQNCGSINALGALTVSLLGLPIWGSTSVIKLPASLGFVSTLVVHGDYPNSYEHYIQFVGRSQLLEEDEDGFLTNRVE